MIHFCHIIRFPEDVEMFLNTFDTFYLDLNVMGIAINITKPQLFFTFIHLQPLVKKM